MISYGHAGTSASALALGDKLILGNIIRNVKEDEGFRNSLVSFYRFVADDDLSCTASVASLVKERPVMTGWLTLQLLNQLAPRKRRAYCVLTQQKIFYYFASDVSMSCRSTEPPPERRRSTNGNTSGNVRQMNDKFR